MKIIGDVVIESVEVFDVMVGGGGVIPIGGLVDFGGVAEDGVFLVRRICDSRTGHQAFLL